MHTSLMYQSDTNWKISETEFREELLGKCESIFCSGNGYMGLRATTEESYLFETKNLFVAGTFNKPNQNEVTELPNAADLIGMEIYLDGERFTLVKGTIKKYVREINLKNGELVRSVIWKSSKGNEFELTFRRFVSMDNLHIIGQSVDITGINIPLTIEVETGIDGTTTNHGVSHFLETEKRLYQKKYMQYVATTNQSQIGFVFNTAMSFEKSGKNLNLLGELQMERRKVYCKYTANAQKLETFHMEKISTVYTTLDRELEMQDIKEIQREAIEVLITVAKEGYQTLLSKSTKVWEENVWNRASVLIESENSIDQLAIRFAQYHLAIMAPEHDERMSIGAKGLSGEGYKGHVFWDTDIFILPYYIFTKPLVARKLELYRYETLDYCHTKACDGGYAGAQYPWESAWITDGEVTPEFGDADIVTGMPQTVWTGLLEQHITADVAYGVWQYYQVTNDEQFMKNNGYELIFDTAKFWYSRLEYGKDNKYHIHNVIGPDEYKEHVSDNAFTNYMAYWNIDCAVKIYEHLKRSNIILLEKLQQKLELETIVEQWKKSLSQIYLPKPNKEGVIPQDTAYLLKKNINLDKYKKQDFALGIYADYNSEQLNDIQVLKQADLILAMVLLGDYFDDNCKRNNWNYYEKRTLHDSSLSLSTHCILANDLQLKKEAYELFHKLIAVDMGSNMKTSDDGIHAASIGGIWQSVIFGFGGVRVRNAGLTINPELPNTFHKLEFEIMWHGSKLRVSQTKEKMSLERLYGREIVEITCKGNKYFVKEKIIEILF